MCKSIFVRATTDDGITPHPEMPEGIEFEGGKLIKWPVCTCWIADKEGEGRKLREMFTEEVLQKFLKISWGNIVIEIR